ncbi:SDR family oxidoreductase [Tunicatimonas pelagia]|uniref:SDR family oxidoreductase n=1 Tax=Tunicatimonas pelagia TaxID=931531 RepID=UPI00266556C6|nr:SDR family oxidoreductase [Tunicatimonas pelagia]WKN43580.1 SDR family oxidoreductase [Tunicatimonas pelagia]
MELQDKVVIVTGASSGIGEATAEKLASHGAKVVLTARREDRLKELKQKIESAGGKALVVTADVTKNEDWKQVVQQAQEVFGDVDVLVNNAGLMPLSFAKKLKTDEWEKMVDVNIKGVLNGVAAVLPKMMDNKRGHIVNISSVAGRKLFPGGSVYCATKFAVRAFSEGLRNELAPEFNIRVTAIEPGAVATELTDTITDEDIIEKIMKPMLDIETLQSEDIAESILYALQQPKHVNVQELLVMPTEQG